MDMMMASVFFLFCSREVHIARKILINRAIESPKNSIPKVQFTKVLSQVMSFGISILNILTNICASSGLNMIYASPIAKNMTVVKKSASTALMIVPGGSGSFGFFGPPD